MRILVLGAAGMAGHIITLYFQEKGHTVTGFTMKPISYCDNIVGDATDTAKLKAIIENGKYDAVINCIGILNTACDDNPSNAVFLNSYLPHFLCEITKNTKTKIIQMSTDCVFSGEAGPYYENSLHDGKTFYDRTKALGEINDNKNLTFRNSIIGCDINVNGIGLFNWFMKQSGTINGFIEVLWTGVTTLTLAKAMERALEENLTGLYNLVNNTSISKYDLLNEFNDIFERKVEIKKNDTLKTKKILVNTRTDFSFIVPSYHDMVLEMKEWVYSHKDFYKHYFE